MNTEKIFFPITKLLKSHKYDQVLSCILNSKSNRIVKPYNSNLNHAWYLVGQSYYKLSYYSDALAAFRKSYRYWKEDIAAIRAIGNCLSELNKPKQAQYYFTKALKIGGEKYKAYDILLYNLGNTYFDLGDYRNAINYYRKVSKNDPESYMLANKNIKHAEKNSRKKNNQGKFKR